MLTKSTIKRRIKEIKKLLKVYTAPLILFNLSFGQITSAFELVTRAGRRNSAAKCYQSSKSRRKKSFYKLFVIFGVRLGKPPSKHRRLKKWHFEPNFKNLTSFGSVSLTDFKADS